MYILTVSATFAAAHHLKEYHGRCERTHGHNWKVDVHIAGNTLGRTGMIVDFTVLKKKTHRILKALDHTHLNTLPYFKRVNPTAENLAKYVHDGLTTSLRHSAVTDICVTVWESDDSRASYSRNASFALASSMPGRT